jgi:pimeloyl-ACP methyl ester carboxylesterase
VSTSANALFVGFPGWATDHRVFEEHRLPGRMVSLPEGAPPAAAVAAIGEPVWLFGWSLGAHAMLDICKCPPSNVLGAIIAGGRPIYPRSTIDAMRTRLEADSQGCLLYFYRHCFYGAPRLWMESTGRRLIDEYACTWNSRELLDGLGTLASKPLLIEPDRPPRLMILHGGGDRVAPVEEARQLAAAAPGALLRVVPEAGHAVFLDGACESVIRAWIQELS